MARYIIDVREAEEYESGHAENAINIPLSRLASSSEKLAEIPKDAEIILYCNSGNRANIAKKSLESMGYVNVVNGINKHQVGL